MKESEKPWSRSPRGQWNLYLFRVSCTGCALCRRCCCCRCYSYWRPTDIMIYQLVLPCCQKPQCGGHGSVCCIWQIVLRLHTRISFRLQIADPGPLARCARSFTSNPYHSRTRRIEGSSARFPVFKHQLYVAFIALCASACSWTRMCVRALPHVFCFRIFHFAGR